MTILIPKYIFFVHLNTKFHVFRSPLEFSIQRMKKKAVNTPILFLFQEISVSSVIENVSFFFIAFDGDEIGQNLVADT